MSAAIRLAGALDLAAVQAIVEAAYAPYIPRMGCKPGPMLDDYAALIAAGHVHVLDMGGVVAGVLVLLLQPDSVLLDNIALAPQAQGKGHASVLLAFAERFAVAAGRSAITLYTNAAMVENIVLYQRKGYVETHRGREKGFDRVYMIKHLPAAQG